MSNTEATYIVDDGRRDFAPTGIYVRSYDMQKAEWVNADISQLTRASLIAFLRSRGESAKMAEDVVGILLDHGHLNG